MVLTIPERVTGIVPVAITAPGMRDSVKFPPYCELNERVTKRFAGPYHVADIIPPWFTVCTGMPYWAVKVLYRLLYLLMDRVGNPAGGWAFDSNIYPIPW